MADKIDTFGRTGLDISPARSRAADQPAPRQDGPGKARQSDDAVNVSATAAQLQRLEARLRDAPDVDQERVAAVRERIASGDFEVDAERLARKLMRLEQDLV